MNDYCLYRQPQAIFHLHLLHKCIHRRQFRLHKQIWLIFLQHLRSMQNWLKKANISWLPLYSEDFLSIISRKSFTKGFAFLLCKGDLNKCKKFKWTFIDVCSAFLKSFRPNGYTSISMEFFLGNYNSPQITHFSEI